MIRFRYEGVNWEGRYWHTAPAITRLGMTLEDIDSRRYATDGTVASRAHDQNSPTSDHRPDLETGSVRAIDFGGTAASLWTTAESLRVSADPRIRYLIHNGRMFSSYARPGYPPYTWRPYGGANPHKTHVHLSVHEARENDTAPWTITPPEEDMGFDYTPPANLTDEDGEIFRDAWLWATELGIVNEHTDPVDIVEKQEMIVFLKRLFDKAILPMHIDDGSTVPPAPLEAFKATIIPETPSA